MIPGGLPALRAGGAALARRARTLSSLPPTSEHEPVGTAPPLSLDLPVYGVWGANTDIGKTLVSMGIAAVSASHKMPLFYLKPVQTGFPGDSDARLVAAAAVVKESYADHAAEAAGVPPSTLQVGEGVTARTLFGWNAAVSPHLAVEREGRPVSDAEVVAAVRAELAAAAAALSRVGGGRALALVETAGGVCSPSPSGRLQVDMLRPLRLPGVLVGEWKLGGISTTLTSADSLILRGCDIEAVVMLEGAYKNHEALGRHLLGGPVTLPPRRILLPPPPGPAQASRPGELDTEAAAWIERAEPALLELLDVMHSAHARRVERLGNSASVAASNLWWPFTQHTMTPLGDVTVIDGRCGEDFTVLKGGGLATQFDGCASWWTQGTDATLQPEMTRALAYSAGRYGHVMFPENSNDVVTGAALRLLAGPGKGWASRVFYSDDGSTAIEVALKMGFRKYILDHGLEAPLERPLRVLGLENAYHGDTLGAMDAQAPSVFNGDMQTPWYEGRGHYVDPPTAAMSKGRVTVRLPADLEAAAAAAGVSPADLELLSWDGLFDPARDGTALAGVYEAAATAAIDESSAAGGGPVGSLIMEPVLLGAGGMLLLDPLYQRTLARVCRGRGIPVIMDEVFSGLWRLGAASGSELIGIQPDVACFAKLLTAGTIPLAATLASEAVFESFLGDSKLHALLHGHSYSGNPIGCGAACRAMDVYTDPVLNPNYLPPGAVEDGGAGERFPSGRLCALWDAGMTEAISHHPRVARVVSIGTVFIAELDVEGGGYASTAAKDVVKGLRANGVYARPLGNVVYLMVTPTTSPAKCRDLQARLIEQLGAH